MKAQSSRRRTERAATTRISAARRKSSPGRSDAPPLHIADGTLEVLKWTAMILMTLDHVNKYLLDASVPALYALGRLALPIFGFALAYNLARPQALADGVHVRVMKRLTIYGALATPAFWMLVGWWPLNVLFMLLAITVILWLYGQGGLHHRWLAALVLVVGGALVEFWWFGIFYGLACWAYCRSPSLGRGTAWVAATALLGVVNGNVAALAALPLLIAATQARFTAPRLRWLAYGFYPAHLTLIAIVARF